MQATKPFLVLFGERMKQLREAKSLQVGDAADKLGCYRTYVYKMESGSAAVSTRMFTSIAKLYEVDEADLCSFPALNTRHELFDVARDLPEESLQQLLREARQLAKAAKRSAPAAADPKHVWQHVRANQPAPTPTPAKATRKKVG